MRRMIHDMREMLRTNRGSILIFEILYRIFTAFVLIEAASRGISFALKKAGFSYLTARNALKFFCSPVTILVLAGFLLLCLFFVCLEMCVLYTAFQAGVIKEEMSPIKMLIFGMKNVVELFQTKNARILLVNANFYLLTGSWIMLRLVKHIRPLSYIVTELAGFRLVKILAWVLLVIMTCVSLIYVYAPAISILRDVRFRESSEKSRKIFRRHWLPTIGLLAGSNLFAYLLYYIGQFVLKVLAALAVVLFADKSTELALILTISNDIDIAALILASIAGLYLNLGSLTFLLYRYQNKKYEWEIPPYHYHLSAGIRRIFTVIVISCLAAAGALYVYDSVYTGTVKASAILSEAKITSHRGNSFEAPENTLPAIEGAIDTMSDYVEIDVQETKDGIIVVHHDASLKRTTGTEGRLWDYTYGDLLLLDFGSWFSEEFAGTQIPTLEQALEACKGHINMNIELKANRLSDTLVEKTLQLIEDHGMEAQVVLSSTSYRYLKEVKEQNPDIRTGYILTAAYGNYFEDENIDFFSIRSSFVTSSLVKSAHDFGKEVHAWTVNTKSELSRMKRLQVDNIITDRPVLAREILYRESDTESIFEFLKLALKVGR
ncbi:glycerophosphodiester phosphodiesterase [Lacrimispora sp. NSJ-141]|uniref:Glycerophosphodiester phosphodiesterase n=1 Tax=Lientehia hominis TaxID=2897778 RepID=A0AAP2W9U0_9FIRM|nr:glycerophosphodiester phosphodiesterase [Lientehia hominis]MCD2492297.1 glycerophosphodiester phosphodiesterase [Lientehia hominis]